MLCYDMTYLRLQLGAHNSQPNQVNSALLLFIVAVHSLHTQLFHFSGGSFSLQYYCYCFHSFVIKEMDRCKYWLEFLSTKT